MTDAEGNSDDLSSQDRTRDEIVAQLRISLARAENKMQDHALTPKELQHWMRIHTNIALVLNTVLRDVQLRDWEKRMRILEKYGIPTDNPSSSNSEP